MGVRYESKFRLPKSQNRKLKIGVLLLGLNFLSMAAAAVLIFGLQFVNQASGNVLGASTQSTNSNQSAIIPKQTRQNQYLLLDRGIELQMYSQADFAGWTEIVTFAQQNFSLPITTQVAAADSTAYYLASDLGQYKILSSSGEQILSLGQQIHSIEYFDDLLWLNTSERISYEKDNYEKDNYAEGGIESQESSAQSARYLNRIFYLFAGELIKYYEFESEYNYYLQAGQTRQALFAVSDQEESCLQLDTSNHQLSRSANPAQSSPTTATSDIIAVDCFMLYSFDDSDLPEYARYETDTSYLAVAPESYPEADFTQKIIFENLLISAEDNSDTTEIPDRIISIPEISGDLGEKLEILYARTYPDTQPEEIKFWVFIQPVNASDRLELWELIGTELILNSKLEFPGTESSYLGLNQAKSQLNFLLTDAKNSKKIYSVELGDKKLPTQLQLDSLPSCEFAQECEYYLL